MLFNSVVFLFVFLPITLLGLALFGRRFGARAGLGWLLLASLFFYGWWNPKYLVLLAASVLFNYSVGRVLGGDAPGHRARTSLLAAGVAANLGLLATFKYADFAVWNLNLFAGANLPAPGIVLPLAISFFTFQQIAYLVDAYRERQPERDLLHYGVFVTFFPQLIAGPIVHHHEMLPQFRREQAHLFGREDLQIGLSMFAMGLFKKTVIADGVAPYATPIFEAAALGAEPGLVASWGAALAYTLQLYFDFSGYSDMAIGLGRMIGIRLPLNFESPYKASSIIEFWRRWHMTLSRFLRDYLYFSLGGNRRGPVRRYVNLLVTMVLGGLWHGAGWTFVVWGALHGGFLLVNHGFRSLASAAGFASLGPRALRVAASRAITFLAVVVAWVFFRAADIASALRVLGGMVGRNGAELPQGLEPILGLGLGLRGPAWSYAPVADWTPLLVVASLVLTVLAAPNTRQILGRFEVALSEGVRVSLPESPRWWQWRPSVPWAMALAFITVWAVLGINQYSEFLYFQF